MRLRCSSRLAGAGEPQGAGPAVFFATLRLNAGRGGERAKEERGLMARRVVVALIPPATFAGDSVVLVTQTRDWRYRTGRGRAKLRVVW